MPGKTVKIRFNARRKGDMRPCDKGSLFPPEAVHQRLLYLSAAVRKPLLMKRYVSRALRLSAAAALID